MIKQGSRARLEARRQFDPKMAFQREMTPSLKTKLDDIVETLKHDGFISREADISAISRYEV